MQAHAPRPVASARYDGDGSPSDGQRVHRRIEKVGERARSREQRRRTRSARTRAELISKNFGVQTHEVAILGLTSDGRSLRFLAPDNLRTVGQIPLSSTNSLAARTVREKRPELINHFSVVPHASVFEAVPIAEEQRGDPIQKIMSSPILLGEPRDRRPSGLPKGQGRDGRRPGFHPSSASRAEIDRRRARALHSALQAMSPIAGDVPLAPACLFTQL